MHVRIGYLLILLTLSTSTLFSQDNDYIVNAQRDTVKGVINRKDWSHNPTAIGFQTSNEVTSSLTPNDIRSFHAGDAHYDRFVVNISMDQTKLTEYDRTHHAIAVTDTVFLERLETGKTITLYTYTDAIKTRFYFYTGLMRTPKELVYRIAPTRNEAAFHHFRYYQRQLDSIATTIPEKDSRLVRIAQHANYTKSDLLRITTMMNGNKKSDRRKNSNYRSAIPYVGLSMFKPNVVFKYDGNKFPDQDASPSISVNAGIDLYFKPSSGQFFGRFDFGYDQYKSTMTRLGRINSRTTTEQYALDVKSLSFNLTGAYHVINKNKFKWYLGAGIGYTLLLDKETFYNRTEVRMSNGEEKKYAEVFTLDNQIQITLTTGIRIKESVSIHADWLLPRQYCEINLTDGVLINGLRVGINYAFLNRKRH